jgi:hypothetical protein
VLRPSPSRASTETRSAASPSLDPGGNRRTSSIECVWAKPTDCEGPEACPSADARVYWRDLGAGTVALATFGCDIRPSDSEAYESCDFGSDVAIPLVCDCGCD